MKNNRCEQCGARINISSMSCDYCGANYAAIKTVSETTRLNNNIVMSLTPKNIISLLEKLNPSFLTVMPVIIFMIIWCSIALIMGIFAVSFAGIVGIVPFFMCVIGASVMGATIKSISKERIIPVLEACRQDKWNEALKICEAKEDKNNNYVLAYILIQAHYFKKYEDVGQKIARVPDTVLAKTLFISPAWSEIAELYGRKVESSSNNLMDKIYRNFNNRFPFN